MPMIYLTDDEELAACLLEVRHPVEHHVRVVPVAEGDEQRPVPGHLRQGAPHRIPARHSRRKCLLKMPVCMVVYIT